MKKIIYHVTIEVGYYPMLYYTLKCVDSGNGLDNYRTQIVNDLSVAICDYYPIGVSYTIKESYGFPFDNALADWLHGVIEDSYRLIGVDNAIWY